VVEQTQGNASMQARAGQDSIVQQLD